MPWSLQVHDAGHRWKTYFCLNSDCWRVHCVAPVGRPLYRLLQPPLGLSGSTILDVLDISSTVHCSGTKVCTCPLLPLSLASPNSGVLPSLLAQGIRELVIVEQLSHQCCPAVVGQSFYNKLSSNMFLLCPPASYQHASKQGEHILVVYGFDG